MKGSTCFGYSNLRFEYCLLFEIWNFLYKRQINNSDFL
ncbi:hypothetical protein D1AOALGA4SA_12190 [Olavius algarvensis Delta 1 endosymbiont]|nr:hypothetical protein D1AOALGA4SA_12190 [Olavius algarvensis Delta 1 endosymbiont]